MDIVEYLSSNGTDVVREATEKLARAGMKHYEAAGFAATEERLGVLLERVLESLAQRRLTPVVDHAVALARERYEAGYDLSEVQTTINALEEIVWTRVVRDLPPEQYAEALGLVGTVLGAAKDALARSYVSLASRSHAPSLDLKRLFAGTAGS